MTDGSDPDRPPDPRPEPTAALAGPGPPAAPADGTVAWTPGGEPAAAATRPLAAWTLAPPAGPQTAAGGPPLAAPRENGGRAAPAGQRLAVGDLLAGRFRIVRFIGHGGMGDVYEAEDLELGERVALKTVRPEVASLTGAIDRFRREIQLARKVTHPNVCRIFDVFRHRPEGEPGAGEEITFFSMELLAGETLEERLRRDGRMRPEQALPIVSQVALGLAAAHQAGVIHRDLKPANIMLAPAGGPPRAVVTDFGLARTRAEGETLLTMRGNILGTPSYMAPEQVSGGEVTAATDLYALGAVVYEMVTGSPPFTGENSFAIALKRLREDPQPPRQRVPGLDPVWDAAILRCLERKPADRFAQVTDLAAALAGDRVAGGTGRRRRLLRRRALAAAAALALLAGLVLAGQRWLRTPRGRAVVESSASPLAALLQSPEELYAGGVKQLGKLDAPRAQELFEQAIAARREYWLARSGLAVALGQLGHDDRAGAEAKLALDHAAGLPRGDQLLIAARYWQVAGRWDRALESYQALRSASPDDLDRGLGLVQALVGAGRGGEASQALAQLGQLPVAAAAAARLSLAEAEVAKSLSDFPREERAARRAREQAERDGDDLLAARALRLEGSALANQGDRAAALGAFNKAEAIYAGTADQRSLAQVLAATAAVLYYQGQFEQAKEKAKEAIDSFKEVGDLRSQSVELDLLAAIEGEQGNPAGAESRYAAAIDNYRRLGDRAHEAEATFNLGIALKMQGKLGEAARRYDQALALYGQQQNRSGEAQVLYRLAGAAFDQLDLGQARAFLARSLNLATAINDQTRRVDALLLDGELAAARGDLVAARGSYDEALTRSRGLGDKRSTAEAQLALASLEVDESHPSTAAAYARSALAQFRGEHMDDQEAVAGAVLTLSLLAQRAAVEARGVLAQAERLAAKSVNPEVKIVVAIARAHLDGPASLDEDRRLLARALAQAREAGLGELGLEVRLAEGEIEAERGNRQRAAELLTGLEKDARGHGFIRVADRAARARAGGRPGAVSASAAPR